MQTTTLGADGIRIERIEQIEKHLHTIEDDQKYKAGELEHAAIAVIHARHNGKEEFYMTWPWGLDNGEVDAAWETYSKKSAIELYAIAGAFLAAEIDRIWFAQKHDVFFKGRDATMGMTKSQSAYKNTLDELNSKPVPGVDGGVFGTFTDADGTTGVIDEAFLNDPANAESLAAVGVQVGGFMPPQDGDVPLLEQ